MFMLPTKGPQSEDMGEFDPRWVHGSVTGYSNSSNAYHIFEEGNQKMTLAKRIQRVPADQRWKPEGLEGMNVPCKQLYDRRAARGVQVEGFAEDPNAKVHDQGRVRAQRVWIYEKRLHRVWHHR